MKNLLLISLGLFFVIHTNYAQTASVDDNILSEAKKVAEQTEDIQVWECKKKRKCNFRKVCR